jgi:hypothetical protein
MTRIRLILGLFGAALVCGLILVTISDLTVIPMVARGNGLNGVQVTTGGWIAFLVSLLATSGFTLTGFLALVAHFLLRPSAITAQSEPQLEQTLVTQIAELTESFTSLLTNQDSRAAQRRFVFALVDAAGLLQGCQSSHDNGVIVIRYSGYADPVVVSIPVQGGK